MTFQCSQVRRCRRSRSHFGSWDEPRYYERPRLGDGTRGSGCVLTGPAEGYGVSEADVERLFRDYGARDDPERLWFGSQRSLIDALKQAGLATGQGHGQEIAYAIERQYGVPDHIVSWGSERPILLGTGARAAKTYTWRGFSQRPPEPEPPSPERLF